MSDGRRAMVLMLVFVALWALVEALAAHVLKHYSPYQVVWTRYAVHLAFMLAVWGWREPATLWRTRRPVYQLARSLLMLGMPASWVIAVQHGVDRGALMSIFWLAPLFIVALARLFLGESAGPSVWLSCGAASLGAMLVGGLGRMPPVEGWVFPLAMALSFAGYVVMTRPLRRESTRANLFYTAIGVFAALTPAMPALWVSPGLHDLAILAGVGLFGFAGLYAMDRMAAAAPVSATAPIAAMQVTFTVLPGVVLGYQLPGQALVGLLLIGVVAVITWSRAPGRTDPHLVDKTA